ncbi:hypothetical protein SKAU_G00384980 [Synaphobranchus kaupii]|uniref:Uncharacterized protein n=1 Tax=Synaphobranchus kaupii TaxID=118154 RepID=A0A9Q1EEF1_SYNKA|nr:hypothetical protein SKAU_G00384980 [Synaphobranchus kaupii]
MTYLHGKINVGVTVDWAVYEGVKSRIRELLEGRVRSVAFQARVREMEEGEKPSSYFFQAIRARRNASAIPGRRGGDGLVTEIEPMLAVAETFYSKLFSARICDPEAQEACLKAITARLGNNEAGVLDSPLSLEEMFEALGESTSADGAALLTTVDMETPTALGDSPDSEGGPVAEWAKTLVRKRAASRGGVSPKVPKSAAVEIPLANRFEVLAGTSEQDFPDFEMDLVSPSELLGWDAELLEAVMGLPPEQTGDLRDVEWWEAAKHRFKVFCQRYGGYERRREKAQFRRLLASMTYLHGKINVGVTVDWAVYEGVKSRIRELMEGRVRSVAFQARVREMEEGEKPSSYFFQAIRARRNASVIPGLRGGDGLVTEIEPMLAVAETFYSKLFSARICDPEAQEACLRAITARLGNNEAGVLDSPLSLEEMFEVLELVRRDPGIDGVVIPGAAGGSSTAHLFRGCPERGKSYAGLLQGELFGLGGSIRNEGEGAPPGGVGRASTAAGAGLRGPSTEESAPVPGLVTGPDVAPVTVPGPASAPRPDTTPEVGLPSALVVDESEVPASAPVPVPGSARVGSPALGLRGSAEAYPGISTGPGFVQVFGPGAAPPAVSVLSLAGDAVGGVVSGSEDGLAVEAESAVLQSLELFPRLEGGVVSGDLEVSADGVALPTTVDMKSPAVWGDSLDFEGGPVAEWAKQSVRKRAASGEGVSPKGPKAAAVGIPLANRFEVLAGTSEQGFPDFEMDLDPSSDLLGWDAEQLEAGLCCGARAGRSPLQFRVLQRAPIWLRRQFQGLLKLLCLIQLLSWGCFPLRFWMWLGFRLQLQFLFLGRLGFCLPLLGFVGWGWLILAFLWSQVLSRSLGLGLLLLLFPGCFRLRLQGVDRFLGRKTVWSWKLGQRSSNHLSFSPDWRGGCCLGIWGLQRRGQHS